jgi:hypothetical protein
VEPLILLESLDVVPVAPAPEEPAPAEPLLEPAPLAPAPVEAVPLVPALPDAPVEVPGEPLVDAWVRMNEFDAPAELPVEPVALPDPLPLADCRQPVSLTWPLWVSERDPLDVCPPCPVPLDPLPVVGCCAEVPTASAALSMVPKMNCRFMLASM